MDPDNSELAQLCFWAGAPWALTTLLYGPGQPALLRRAVGVVIKENSVEQERRFFRRQVDETGITDALYDYVIDPLPTRNDRAVIRELHEVAPEMVDVMESMVLDGVDQRAFVADYIHAVLSDGT